MPTSGWHKIGHVMGVLRHVPDPSSILDIGIGFGKFGFLFREHLDVRKCRYTPREWKARIDGVEVWPEYITPVHPYVYDKLHFGDIRKLVDSLPAYDLIILADVIEHMSELEGAQLLRTLFERHCNKGMVVSYPPVLGGGWQNWDNPHEQHHCIWTAEKLALTFAEQDVELKFSSNQVCFILRRD